jgi:hypothetical protein
MGRAEGLPRFVLLRSAASARVGCAAAIPRPLAGGQRPLVAVALPNGAEILIPDIEFTSGSTRSPSTLTAHGKSERFEDAFQPACGRLELPGLSKQFLVLALQRGHGVRSR